jgi:hypothetical protein
MVLRDSDRAKLFRGAIRTVAAAADAGLRRPGEIPLEPDPHCDLCGSRPRVGRLRVGGIGLGRIERADGSSAFYGWPVEDPRDGMFWVCLPCDRLLRQDRKSLLQRMLAAHAAGRSN